MRLGSLLRQARIGALPTAFLCLGLWQASASRVYGCQCESILPFAAAAESSPRVVIGRVKEWGKESMFVGREFPYRMVVEIRSSVKGRGPKREVVFQGHGTGVCEAAINEFPVGSTWAFALPEVSDDQPIELSICGPRRWLEMKTGPDGRPDPTELKRVKQWAKGRSTPK